MGWCDLHVVGPNRQIKQVYRPVGQAPAIADREQRADQAAHHRVTEGVGLDPERDGQLSAILEVTS